MKKIVYAILIVFVIAAAFLAGRASITRENKIVPTYRTKSAFGFYLHNGIQYNYTVSVTRENCGKAYCPAVITFASEYGAVMYVNDMKFKKSIAIDSGDRVDLPEIEEDSWEITNFPYFTP